MKIKKLIISLLVFAMVSVHLSTVFSKEDEFTFENKEAYNTFLEMQKSSCTTKNKKRSMISESSMDILTSSIDMEAIRVFAMNDSNEAQISYNKTTDQYILAEVDGKTNTILLGVDNERYIIKIEVEDIVMMSQTGKRTVISKMEYQNGNDSREYLNNFTIPNYEISTMAYSKEYGPFYKTNKSIVSVLGVISAATGLCTVVHPILGTISLVTGVGSVGLDGVIATCYIKYWQAMDGTKVKERQRWYRKANYTDFIKERTIYFDSSKPVL